MVKQEDIIIYCKWFLAQQWAGEEHQAEAESLGKQCSPEMVCCTVKGNNVKNHIGASVPMNTIYGRNRPTQPVFRGSNDHGNLFLSPIYWMMLMNICGKVYGLKPQDS